MVTVKNYLPLKNYKKSKEMQDEAIKGSGDILLKIYDFIFIKYSIK